MLHKEKALVLFSGGQDSAVCLLWALQTFAQVQTIGFDYGQKHAVELEVRFEFLRRLPEALPGWPRPAGDRIVNLRGLFDVENDLTGQAAAPRADGLPTTFVPGRNLIFFAAAAAGAAPQGIKHLVGGMCETDYSGYPDCRDDALKALQAALSLGLGQSVVIHTPLMWLSKAATRARTLQLGGEAADALVREHTHTCYHGVREKLHAWGYGCGTCAACVLRRSGYEA